MFFLENEARLVLLNLALKFFFPKNRPLKVYGILNYYTLSSDASLRFLCRAQKIEDLTKSKNFCTEIPQKIRGFV